MIRLALVFVLLAALLHPVAAAAQQPRPPLAETRPAVTVGTTSATLVAGIDPAGSATEFYFEYGTSTAYGLRTDARSAGSVAGGVEVTAPVTGLSRATTYHYRVVATSAGGQTVSEDGTFTTLELPNPLLPRPYQLAVQANSPTAPVVQALVNPRGANTTWRIEYGHTGPLALTTPVETLPAGEADVAVTATLAGLEPNRRVYWRVVATNAAGVRSSRRRSFLTQRAPTGIALAAEAAIVRWGGRVTVRGRVDGAGVGGIRLALQRSTFPFAAALADVAFARADAGGHFAFDAGPLLFTTRFMVRTRSPVLAISPLLTASPSVLVGAGTGRAVRGRVPIAGRVRPTLPSGRAALERLEADGTWSVVRRKRLADLVSFSAYRFSVRRQATPRTYRVVVSARDGGAHAPGVSRRIRVGARG